MLGAPCRLPTLRLCRSLRTVRTPRPRTVVDEPAGGVSESLLRTPHQRSRVPRDRAQTLHDPKVKHEDHQAGKSDECVTNVPDPRPSEPPKAGRPRNHDSMGTRPGGSDVGLWPPAAGRRQGVQRGGSGRRLPRWTLGHPGVGFLTYRQICRGHTGRPQSCATRRRPTVAHATGGPSGVADQWLWPW